MEEQGFGFVLSLGPKNGTKGHRANLAFDFLQYRQKIAAAMHNSLDSDSVLADSKENHIVAYRSQSSFRA